jgi:FAD/FMN-containing dehydrogenase
MFTNVARALDVSALRETMAGHVAVPGDRDWDAARQAWNLAVDQRPAAVAEPVSVADVVAVVRFAREAGLRVAAQGTGHNAAPLGGLYDTILVKTHCMRAVEIDPETRRASVQAGATWGDVVGPAAEHGLAALSGSSHDVGVVGYTLGGGMSWIAREHGLAANNVAAIQVVTADGRVRVVDHEHDPDLFWALRGGGGSFGIVTAIDLELVELREIYAGMMVWPMERAREVMVAWRAWAQDAPDAATTAIRLLRVPPLPDIPEIVRGRAIVAIDGAVLGDEADAVDVLAPLRALAPEIDTFAMVPVPALLEIHMDPPAPVPFHGDGAMVDGLPAAAIDAILEVAGPDRQTPLLMVELRQLGGAVGRSDARHGAVDTLDGDFLMFTGGMVMGPEAVPAIAEHVDSVKDALGPWDRGRRYLGFAERPIDTRQAYGELAHRRLRAVKTLVDPDDVFRAAQPIAPID